MMVLLIIAIVLTALAPMLHEALKGEFTFFNPKNPFIAYYVVELALSAIVTMSTGSVPFTGLDYSSNHDAYTEALLVALIGLLSYQAGYYFKRSRGFSLPSIVIRPWGKARATLVALACFASGGISFLLLMQLNGGLGAFVESRESWRGGGMNGQGFLLFPATTLVSFGAHIMFISHVTCDTPRKRLLGLLALYGLALVPAYMVGFRSLVAIPLLQLLVIWNFRRGKVSAPALVASGAIMIAGFTAYGVVREIPRGLPFNSELFSRLLTERPDLALTAVSRTRGVEMLATIIHRLHEDGEYDVSLKSPTEAITIFIPRKLWTEKPLSTGERFTTYFFGNDFVFARGTRDATFGGMSPTIVGEFYWHLGLAAVVVGLFALGFVTRAVLATMQRYHGSPGVLLAYAVLYTTITLMAESFQGYLNGLVLAGLALIPLLVALSARLRVPVAPSAIGLFKHE